MIYPLTSKANEWWEYVVEASSDPTGEPEDQECEDEEDEKEREDENDGDGEGENDYDINWTAVQESWNRAAQYDAEYERKWDHYDRKENRRLRRGIGPPELHRHPYIEETMWKRHSISSADSEDSE